MRRLLFCPVAILLATGLAVCPVSVLWPTASVAQTPPRSEGAGSPFKVPAVDESQTLQDFIQAVKAARPESGRLAIEYAAKAPQAIRSACERILDLEKAADSPASLFARRELLTLRIADLEFAKDSGPDEADPQERQRFATEAVKLLKDSGREAVDVELATTLAIAFEDVAPPSEAMAFYEQLGELFAGSPREEIARRGEFLRGAGRRLALVGKPLELEGRTFDGQPFEIGALKGKVVLVAFWATWCDHCRQELPGLQSVYDTYHDQGFEIIGVCLDDDRDDVQRFLKKHKLPWPTLHDAQAGSEHPAAIRYGITGYPTSFLLGRDGRVLAIDLRGRKLDRKLAQVCGQNRGRPYPVFNVGSLVEQLTSTGGKLLKAGKTKGDRDLRQQMNRQTAEVDLCEPRDDIISDRDLYRTACESVFIVCSLYKDGENWETSLATAFAISRDGVLTTSCHVFDNDDEADAVLVMDMHQKIYPVKELLAVNRKADTCLFRIEARDLKPLPLGDDGVPGTPVRVLGHPGNSFYYLTSGLVANYEKDEEGLVWLNTTADFGQGASGGPVLDEYGNVIGQVSRTYTLYAGGPATRGRLRRTSTGPVDLKRDREPAPREAPDADVADPQMVFKSCVPVRTLRSLIKEKQAKSP